MVRQVGPSHGSFPPEKSSKKEVSFTLLTRAQLTNDLGQDRLAQSSRARPTTWKIRASEEYPQETASRATRASNKTLSTMGKRVFKGSHHAVTHTPKKPEASVELLSRVEIIADIADGCIDQASRTPPTNRELNISHRFQGHTAKKAGTAAQKTIRNLGHLVFKRH